MKKDFTVLEGEVVECLPNTTFKVFLTEKPLVGKEKAEAQEAELDKEKKDSQKERTILCHLSGKMRINRIRVIPGDKVKVEMTPYDRTRGRIVYRIK